MFFKNGKDFEKVFYESSGQLSKIYECKIVIVFLSISKNMCIGCTKEPSHEMVLLSTHIICFE